MSVSSEVQLTLQHSQYHRGPLERKNAPTTPPPPATGPPPPPTLLRRRRGHEVLLTGLGDGARVFLVLGDAGGVRLDRPPVEHLEAVDA